MCLKDFIEEESYCFNFCQQIVCSLTHKQLEMYSEYSALYLLGCPDAKAPGHQYPQCWPNIDCIWPMSYTNILNLYEMTLKYKFWKKKDT